MKQSHPVCHAISNDQYRCFLCSIWICLPAPSLFLLCPRVNSGFYFLALHGRWVISGLHIWLLVLVKYLLNAAWTELVVLWTRLLQTAQGSLLDDEQLVNTLNSSKTTSQDVAEQLQVSEQTEIKIDAAREVIAFPFNEDFQSSFYSKLKRLVHWYCNVLDILSLRLCCYERVPRSPSAFPRRACKLVLSHYEEIQQLAFEY